MYLNEKNYCEQLHQAVKQSFEIEAMGFEPRARINSEDARALMLLYDLMKRIEGDWEFCLLWKSDSVKLPNNYSGALSRLQSIERKMDKDPLYSRDEYCAKVEEYLRKSYARKLSKEEIVNDNGRIQYLPPFGVRNPNKPGKFRFVFDAAAKYGDVSLHDALVSGPDFLTPLLGVLFRFRQNEIAFTANICEMFHQVRIRKEDQNAQRFLWRGMDKNRAPGVYVIIVMTFGATCSPCRAQYVRNRNAMEFSNEFPRAVNGIIDITQTSIQIALTVLTKLKTDS